MNESSRINMFMPVIGRTLVIQLQVVFQARVTAFNNTHRIVCGCLTVAKINFVSRSWHNSFMSFDAKVFLKSDKIVVGKYE